jgi:hypothetical protein
LVGAWSDSDSIDILYQVGSTPVLTAPRRGYPVILLHHAQLLRVLWHTSRVSGRQGLRTLHLGLGCADSLLYASSLGWSVVLHSEAISGVRTQRSILHSSEVGLVLGVS